MIPLRKISSIMGVAFLLGCSNEEEIPVSKIIKFSAPQPVSITGYSDHIMEPFLSRDGATLFFNNSNDPTVNTNLHWATRVDDLTFAYEGEVQNVNSAALDGVATVTENGKLYFVSTRSYSTTFSTLYQADYLNGAVNDVSLVGNLSKGVAGWLNFDVEVTADGNHLYFADGRYDQTGGPHEANLVIADKSGSEFFIREDQSILKYVNTLSDLEYAAGISVDELELYFTRVAIPLTVSSVTQIYVTTRNNTDDPFALPSKITEATGFVEAPTISPDGQKIYYHKKENNVFVLYMITKVK